MPLEEEETAELDNQVPLEEEEEKTAERTAVDQVPVEETSGTDVISVSIEYYCEFVRDTRTKLFVSRSLVLLLFKCNCIIYIPETFFHVSCRDGISGLK